LAAYHTLPFYVAAPYSTLDRETASGEQIVIEERSAAEVTDIKGLRIAADIAVRHPAFDVTPAKLIAAIITDRGVVRAPYLESLAGLF